MARTRDTRRSPGVLMLLVVLLAACAIPTPRASPVSGERMPGPASIGLTSVPEVLRVAVPVKMTSPSDPALLFKHTFVPGVPVRGTFATSQGLYRLAAFDGACALELSLDPSQVADVVLRLDDAGCSLAVRRLGRIDDPAMQQDDGAILITNHGAGNETPFIEPLP